MAFDPPPPSSFLSSSFSTSLFLSLCLSPTLFLLALLVELVLLKVVNLDYVEREKTSYIAKGIQINLRGCVCV